MAVAVRYASPRVKSVRGKVALTRGPLVYCLESPDNVGLDLFETRITAADLEATFSPDHLGGIWVLRGRTAEGETFTAIPYSYWANRGTSQMTVWINA